MMTLAKHIANYLACQDDRGIFAVTDDRMESEIQSAINCFKGSWEIPIPELACPECGADDDSCIRDGFIDVGYPDGDNSTIVYRYCCPKCRTYFKETLKRVSVEKY